MDDSSQPNRRFRICLPRRTLLKGAGALGLSGVLGAPFINRLKAAEAHPLAGKKIEMNILGIAGWLPSSLGVKMSPLFADYVKERYGYDVTFGFAEAPFSDLFQKAATSLATKSQEYNIIISDSQWLGALAKPGWILKLNDIIAKNKGLQIPWYSQTGDRHLHALPRRQPGHLGPAAGRRHQGALRAQGSRRGPEGAGRLPGQIQHEAALDLRGLREPQRRRLREGDGVLHPSRQGLVGRGLAVQPRLRLLHLPAVLRHVELGRPDLGCQDRPGRGRAEHAPTMPR